MKPEIQLLSLLLDPEKYKKYRHYIKISPEYKETKILYNVLDILHKKYPDTSKSFDDLDAMVYVCYPNIRPVEKEAIDALIEGSKTSKVSMEVVNDLVRSIQVRNDASALALAALQVSEGQRDPGELASLYDKIQNPETKTLDERDNFVTDDLDNLYNSAIMGPGLNWRLNCLNRSLGPLRPGDFGFLFARPESGKTTFLADQCTYFAGQAKRPIVWFNNEEQGEKVRLRTFEAALGLSLDEVWQDKAKNLITYRKITNNCLKIYDDANIHKNDVEHVIKTWDPEVVVFDQIDKIRGFQADRPDLVYGRIYQWGRVLAKGGRAVIGVCQSDGSGEGVKWLTMAHVAEAKTSKQAEADWIIGIGKSNEGGTEDIRYLNISKNKLIGGPDTDPKERHGRFPVFIKPTIARYEDL